MSATEIELNGHALISLKEAAGRVSYSRDYLSKLARDGKVVATQVGRQWFVDFSSLENYLADLRLEKETKKDVLRRERQNELLARQASGEMLEVRSGRVVTATAPALALATVVMVGGLVLGFALYHLDFIGSFGAGLNAVVANASASPAGETVPPADNSYAVASSTIATERENKNQAAVIYPVFTNEAEVRSLASVEAGIFLLPREGGLKTEADIKALFSDEEVVEVKFTGDNSGEIYYRTANGAVATTSFVSVPKDGQLSVDKKLGSEKSSQELNL